MFSFIDYCREIFKIGEMLGVDTGVAYAMLKADIQSGERANTEAVDLGDFDFAKAHATFAAMGEEEQKAAYGEWHRFMRLCFEEAVEAYPDAGKLAQLAADYRAGKFEPKPEEEEA